MSIIDVADLKVAFDPARIDELTNDGSGATDSVVTALIAEAEGIIKTFLAMSYSTAEIEGDAAVKRYCEVIAMYFLEFRRGDFTERIRVGYKETIEALTSLQQGVSVLSTASQLLPTHEVSQDRGPLEQDSLFDGLPVEFVEEE